MGEPRKVEISLVDLKKLVKKMFEAEVYARARLLVETAPGNQIDAAGAFAFAQLVFEAMPEAERAVEPRYRRLREALESGSDVAPALASFADRGQ